MRKRLGSLIRLAPLSIAVMLSACAQQSQISSSAEEPVAALCSDRLTGKHDRIDIRIAAEGRDIPLSLFTPSTPGEYQLIGFSHGAFAAPGRYEAMLGPLAASGYVIAAPMHIDSEEMERPEGASPPSQDQLWRTRNFDMQLALEPPQAAINALGEKGISLSARGKIAMGHSFGSAMAHFASGARAIQDLSVRRIKNIDAVIAWSPPGALDGTVDQKSWSDINMPSLTLTGTTDTLPGFVDDWQLRKVPFEKAPKGMAKLWVGEDVDHYFGGVFGRVKDAPREEHVALFKRALATSLNFIEINNGALRPCVLDSTKPGESYEDNS